MNNAVLIQCATGEHKRLLSLTQHLHKQYCDRHQIDYHVSDGSLQPDDDRDFMLGCKDHLRADNWLRVPLIIEAIQKGYKYVFWLDADCLIVGDTDLRKACNGLGFSLTWHDMSMFRSQGINLYDHWSTGAVYLFNHPHLIDDVCKWNATSDDGHGWADQHALNKIADWLKGEGRAIHTIDPKWNSIHPHFESPEPVVMAWHGFGSVEDRFHAMRYQIHKLVNKPSEHVQSLSLSERFTAAHSKALAGKTDEAIAEYRACLDESPMEPDILRELGELLFNKGEIDEAENVLARSLAYEPNVGGTWCMLGCIDAAKGKHEAARAKYDRALHFSPDMPVAHWNRALNRLMLGDYAEGWKEYRWGRVSKHRRNRFPTDWEWFNTSKPKRLLVWSDQGAGDCIQFSRFLPKLRERLPKAEIVWELHDGLVGLMSSQGLADTLIKLQIDGANPAECDTHIELADIPYWLKINDPADFGFTEPYLKPSPKLVQKWRPQITGDGLKIGLCWKGNPQHANDHNRSMSLADLEPVLDTPHTFYSLQYGMSAEDLKEQSRGRVLPLDIRDWEDTAAIIENLDMVISVDSGVCHLAGALGQSVITLLPFSGDWRWGVSGDTTPWYPTMTLLRQERLKDWSVPVGRLAQTLNDIQTRGNYAK